MRPVSIELDRERKLSYSLNAMCALDELGIQVATTKDLARPKVLRAVLWAGLLDDDPSLTLEQAGKLISVGDLPRLARAIEQAFAGAQPDAAQAPEKKQGPRKARR